MPNNFKIQGDYYVSKAGNDSWNGLTPDTPKRTVQAGLNLITSGTQTLIIGAGVYNETINISFGSVSLTLNIVADGTVIIDGTGKTFTNASSSNPGHQFNWNGFIFKNYTNLNRLTANNVGSTGVTLALINCVTINCSFLKSHVGGSASITFTGCIIINGDSASSGNAGSYSYNKSILINHTNVSDDISNLSNCYLKNCSIFNMTGTFNYNNIQSSTIIMNTATTLTSNTPVQDVYGRWYNPVNAGTGGDGTIGNPYYRTNTLGAGFDFTTHKILYPALNVNSISEDPKFNDILAQDFTLQSGSPHIGRASDGISNIGGTPYAIRAAANSSSFSGSGATVDSGLTFSYNNYVISGSAVTGSVISAPIFISSSAKVIQDIEYNGLLAFNKTTSSFFYSGSNVNVPDFDTYTSASGNPGANPDRLVYYMRLTTGSTQPVVDADWDNGNLWTRGDYNVFEWNTKPSIDVYGRGNGDPNFLVANSSFLRATYIQMKVKLRNDYLQ